MDNNLNGSPEDGMDYAFNTFQCRYFEHDQADVDFAGNTAEFQRWHDFLNALPGPSPQLLFSCSQGGNHLNGIRGSALNLSLTASGGTAPYTWTLISGSLPQGVSLGAGGELSGTPSQSGDYVFGVQATDANGNSATAEFPLTVASPASVPTFASLAQRIH